MTQLGPLIRQNSTTAKVVLGFAAIAVLVVGINNHREEERIRMTKKFVTEAKYSPDKAERMNAVKELEGKTDELAEIAKSGDFRDTRKAALDAVGGNVDVLIKIATFTKCQDTRDNAVNVLGTMVNNLDNVDALYLVTVLSKQPEIKTHAKQRAKMVGSNGALDMDIARYSTSGAERQAAVEKLKKDGGTGLEYVAGFSEYDNTRKAASAALELSGNMTTIEDNRDIIDISRFSECQDIEKPPVPIKKGVWDSTKSKLRGWLR
ncbi:MAG: hypothetical protein Q7S22_03780 [Candidatus Micrarchaeota archaeon]|nr:hypothetical protein [Candidatus Micrarchaeota archaeon]